MSEEFKGLQVELEAPDGGALYAQPEVSGGVLVIALQHENGTQPQRLTVDDKKIVKLAAKSPELQASIDQAKVIAAKMQVATSAPSADGALKNAVQNALADALKSLGLTPEVLAAAAAAANAEKAAATAPAQA